MPKNAGKHPLVLNGVFHKPDHHDWVLDYEDTETKQYRCVCGGVYMVQLVPEYGPLAGNDDFSGI